MQPCDELVGKPTPKLVDDGCAGPAGPVGVFTYPCADGDTWYVTDGPLQRWWGREDGVVESGSQAAYDAARLKCLGAGGRR